MNRDAPAGPAPALQQRLEEHRAGRWLINAFLMATVGAVLVWNLPASGFGPVSPLPVEAYINATGLTQSWKLFAPDPNDHTRDLAVRIHYADGSSAAWRPPRGGGFLDEYRDYHWAAEMSRLRHEAARAQWKPFAAWVVRTADHGGRRPVSVELVRRWRETSAPGSGAPDGPWQESTLFTAFFGDGTRP